jgi:hypothetical protein
VFTVRRAASAPASGRFARLGPSPAATAPDRFGRLKPSSAATASVSRHRELLLGVAGMSTQDPRQVLPVA